MLDATYHEVNSLADLCGGARAALAPSSDRWTAQVGYDSGRLFVVAPVVKWISYRPPEPGVEVRFLSGA